MIYWNHHHGSEHENRKPGRGRGRAGTLLRGWNRFRERGDCGGYLPGLWRRTHRVFAVPLAKRTIRPVTKKGWWLVIVFIVCVSVCVFWSSSHHGWNFCWFSDLKVVWRHFVLYLFRYPRWNNTHVGMAGVALPCVNFYFCCFQFSHLWA